MPRGALAAGLALLLVSVPARAQDDDPLRVFLDKAERVAPTDGYVPVAITAENTDRRPRVLRLEFKSAPLATVTREVPLDPGERRVVSVPLPAQARYWTVVLDTGLGEPRRDTLYWQMPPVAPVLVEGSVSQARPCLEGSTWGESADAHHRAASGVTAETTSPEEALPGGAAIFPAEALPDTLAGYVGYRAVFLLASRFEELPEPKRRALEAYAATGGTLFLGRDATLPVRLLPLLPEGAAPAGLTVYALGRLAAGPAPLGCAGVTAALTGDGVPGYGQPSNRRVVRAEVSEERPRHRGAADLLLEVARAPTGAFVLMVLLFAAVIGPGSFVVRRRYGPHALLAFIPACSLVTCLGIAAYGLLHEGLFTIHHAAHAVTVLDGTQHRAVTAATSAWYPSLAPGRFRLPPLSTVLLPPAGAAPARSLALDWSDGATFTSGLLPSRSYREYVLLSVEPTRARLTTRDAPDGIVVENALGARIRWGEVRRGGRSCQFEGLADGASTVAVRCGAAEPPAELSLATGRRFDAELLDRGAPRPRQDGEFLVWLEEAIFVPGGGLTLASSGSVQLVAGRSAR